MKQITLSLSGALDDYNVPVIVCVTNIANILHLSFEIE